MRILMVFDGLNWYLRSVRLIEHDLNMDEMVYHCDAPLGGPFRTIHEAVTALEAL